MLMRTQSSEMLRSGHGILMIILLCGQGFDKGLLLICHIEIFGSATKIPAERSQIIPEYITVTQWCVRR